MKLKSKLIATIVSICAAIAVMGVGVWAATSSFDVTVTNNVGFSFLALDGTVTISGAAQGNNLSDDAPEALTGTTGNLYDGTATEAVHATVGKNVDGGATYDINWAGADFFKDGFITGNTTKAALEYTIVFDANEGGVADTNKINIKITQNGETPSAPLSTGNAFEVFYFIGTTDSNYARVTDLSKTYCVDATSDIYVKAVLAYTNPNAVSISADDAEWEFKVEMTTASGAASGSELSGGTVTVDTTAGEGAVVTTAGSTANGVYAPTQS